MSGLTKRLRDIRVFIRRVNNMRAFLIGLLFIIGVTVLTAILAGLAFLLYPLLMILGALLWLVLTCSVGILSIWLIGKLVLLILEALKKK